MTLLIDRADRKRLFLAPVLRHGINFVELTPRSPSNLTCHLLFLSAFPRVSSGSGAVTAVPICILIAVFATQFLGPSS